MIEKEMITEPLEIANLEMSSLSRFQLISLTYQNNFKKAFSLVLDTETGEIKKEVFKLE